MAAAGAYIRSDRCWLRLEELGSQVLRSCSDLLYSSIAKMPFVLDLGEKVRREAKQHVDKIRTISLPPCNALEYKVHQLLFSTPADVTRPEALRRRSVYAQVALSEAASHIENEKTAAVGEYRDFYEVKIMKIKDATCPVLSQLLACGAATGSIWKERTSEPLASQQRPGRLRYSIPTDSKSTWGQRLQHASHPTGPDPP